MPRLCTNVLNLFSTQNGVRIHCCAEEECAA